MATLKVLTQDKDTHIVEELGIQGNKVISFVTFRDYIDGKDTLYSKALILGTYETSKRAMEIFSEMSYISWTEKGEKDYVMPNK